jgi:integrating conjugative element protein (TIGR03757 family)
MVAGVSRVTGGRIGKSAFNGNNSAKRRHRLPGFSIAEPNVSAATWAIMAARRFHLPLIAVASAAPTIVGWLLLALVPATVVAGKYSVQVEAFVPSDQARAMDVSHRESATRASISVHVYPIDGLARLDADLSDGLPSDPAAAAAQARAQIAELPAARLDAVRHSAVGLAKAAEYGIDRYPAIVFDSEAVIYGVTDLDEALQIYRTWLGGAGR